MEKKKCSFKKGGFGQTIGNMEAAKKARLDRLGRKPRTAKEHEEWRKKQRKNHIIWRSFIDDEE